MPEVSIIVPVYNVEKYLRECIDSILNQTYKDFELILVNDGSQDKSGEICNEYQSKYKNIIVVHQDNQGQAASRNHGVNISRGKWITFIDSDDVVHPDMLQFLFKAAIESNAGMAVTERIKGENVSAVFFQPYVFMCSTEIVNPERLEYYYDNHRFYYWAPFPSIIKKNILQNIPFPEGRIYEDNAISCQLLHQAKTIAIVPYIMYFYRMNPKGTMNQPLTEKKLDYLWALEEQIHFYKKIQYEKMCKKVAIELLENIFYFSNLCMQENNLELSKKVNIWLKRVKKQYKDYLDKDKRFERKSDKILRPKVYRIKKLLKYY